MVRWLALELIGLDGLGNVGSGILRLFIFLKRKGLHEISA